MLLNKFFIHILIRVTFIVVSSVALGIVLQHLDRGYYYTLVGIILLILLQAYMLVKLINKTNTDLEKFFSSIQDYDSSVKFSDDTKNSTFRKLHSRMDDLNTIIHNVKIENARTSQFLQSIVNHVDIGLLSFDMNGKI